MTRARLAVSAMFMLNGALFGAWASRIPAFVESLTLDPAMLGRLLLCLAAGAIVSFPLAGRFSDRVGAAPATRWIATGYVIALPLLALTPDAVWLALALIVFGIGHGAMDVTMNAWAAEVERAARRPIMARFHAMWSLGAGLGAASGWLAVRMGAAPVSHFMAVALGAGALAFALSAARWDSPRKHGAQGFSLPTRGLLAVGFLALCSSLGEGAMADWSAVYLFDVMRVDEARAALGYVTFSLAMVAARLTADRVIVHLGPVRTARACGALAVAGLGLLIAGQGLAVGLAGFALLGLGYSAIIPLAFSRAANDPKVPPGRALAGVATLGYGGSVLGPAAIGAAAQALSLQAAFGLIAVLAVAIVVFAGALRPPI